MQHGDVWSCDPIALILRIVKLDAMESSRISNPILPVPGVSRNLAMEASATQPAGRLYEDTPPNPPGRGSSDHSTANKTLLRCKKITRIASFNACTIREDPKTM